MARLASKVSLASLCLLWLSGCGTIDNISDDRLVYGGVRQHTKLLADVAKGDDDSLYIPGVRMPWVKSAILVCTVVDLPLSAAGDTLTLPFTLFARSGRKDKAPDGEEAETSTPDAKEESSGRRPSPFDSQPSRTPAQSPIR